MKKLGFIAIFIIVSTNFLIGQTAEELKKAAEFFRQGVEYYQKDEYDKSIQSYSEYLKIRPNDANILYNRGLSYYFKATDLSKNTTDSSKQSLTSAIADFSQVVKLTPNLTGAWIMRGRSYFWLKGDNLKFVESAISDFSRAIQIDANSADVYYERGRAYNEKYQTENALADLNKAIQLNPNKADAYFRRGQVYSSIGKKDLAKSDFQAELRINPNHPYAKIWLDTASQPNNPPQTVAVQNAAQDWKSAFDEGKNALRQYQPEEAITAFQKAINLLPTKFEGDNIELIFANQKGLIQENLAKAQIVKKDYDGAIKTCSSAQEFLYKTLVDKISKIEKFTFNPSMLIEISKSKLDLIIMDYDLALSQTNETVEIGQRCFSAFPQSGLSTEQNISLIGVGLLKIGTAEFIANSFFTTSSVRLSLAQLCQGKGRNLCGEGSRNNEINKYAEKSLADINKAIGYAPALKKFYLHRAEVYRHFGKNDLALADEAKAGRLK